jgi:hypothetical protein
MPDIKMGDTEDVVRASAADAPMPDASGGGHQTALSQPKDPTADASGSGKQKRGPKGKSLVKNEDLLLRTPWSKLSQPDADLDQLIEEGRRILGSYAQHRKDWEEAGKSACDTCNGVHPPPCMTPDEAVLLRMQRYLLKTYESEAEEAAANAPMLSPPPPEVEGKGKAKVAADAQPESSTQAQAGKEKKKATADAPAKQDKSSFKPKGKRGPCERCGNHHSKPCFITDKCAKCNTYHYATKPCLFTAKDVRKWADIMSHVNPGAAAIAAAQVFNEQFVPPANSSSGGKSKEKKRKASDEAGESSSKDKKKR